MVLPTPPRTLRHRRSYSMPGLQAPPQLPPFIQVPHPRLTLETSFLSPSIYSGDELSPAYLYSNYSDGASVGWSDSEDEGFPLTIFQASSSPSTPDTSPIDCFSFDSTVSVSRLPTHTSHVYLRVIHSLPRPLIPPLQCCLQPLNFL